MIEKKKISRTPRQIFGNWRKSRVGQEVIRDIKRRQLEMCVGCMKSLPTHYHVHHLKPIVQLDSTDPMIFDESNIVLLCTKCNLKFPKDTVDDRFD